MNGNDPLIDPTSLITGVLVAIVVLAITYFGGKLVGFFARKIPLIWHENYDIRFAKEVKVDGHLKIVSAYFSQYEFQNLTNRKLENIELIFYGNPENYKMEPNRILESTVNSNGSVITFESVSPKERFSLTLENESQCYLKMVKCNGVEMEKLFELKLFPRSWFVLPFGDGALTNLMIFLAALVVVLPIGKAVLEFISSNPNF